MSDNKTLERSKRAIRQAFWASKGMSLPDTSGIAISTMRKVLKPTFSGGIVMKLRGFLRQ